MILKSSIKNKLFKQTNEEDLHKANFNLIAVLINLYKNIIPLKQLMALIVKVKADKN